MSLALPKRAALAAVCLALVAGDALAAPTVAETASFARRELTRLCDSRHLSRFDGIDDAKMFRDCVATVTPRSVAIELRYRSGAQNGASADAASDRSGRITTSIEFRRNSRFFCGTYENDGKVGLFFSCQETVRFDGAACVERVDRSRALDRPTRTERRLQSVAKMFEIPPRDCAVAERALNYLVSRGGGQRRPSTRDYFATQ